MTEQFHTDITPYLTVTTVAPQRFAEAMKHHFGPLQHLVRPYAMQLASRHLDCLGKPSSWALVAISNGGAFLEPAEPSSTQTYRYRDDERNIHIELSLQAIGIIITLKTLQALAEQPFPMLGLAQLQHRFQLLHDFALQSSQWVDIFEAIF